MNPKNRSKLNRITFGADDELKAKIEAAAGKAGKSVASWCAEVMARAIRTKKPVIRMGRPKKEARDE